MNFFFANAFFLLHCCIFIGRYRSLRTRFLIGLLDVTQMKDTMRVLGPYAGSKTLLWLTRWNLRKWKNLRFRQNAMTRSMITCRNSIEVSTLLFSLPSSVVYSAICINSAWVSISSFNGKLLWRTRNSLKMFREAYKSSLQFITAFESTNPLWNILTSAWLLGTHKDRSKLRRSTCWFNQFRKTFVRPAFFYLPLISFSSLTANSHTKRSILIIARRLVAQLSLRIE